MTVDTDFAVVIPVRVHIYAAAANRFEGQIVTCIDDTADSRKLRRYIVSICVIEIAGDDHDRCQAKANTDGIGKSAHDGHCLLAREHPVCRRGVCLILPRDHLAGTIWHH